MSAAEQCAAFGRPGEPLLRSLAVLEDFRDVRYAPAGKKGMLWTMTYRADDRTLTDEDVAERRAAIERALDQELGGKLRG